MSEDHEHGRDEAPSEIDRSSASAHPRPGSPVSRRSFLKGMGTGALGSALLGGATATENAAEAAPASGVVGPGLTRITLSVNGTGRQAQVEPRTTLANVLRNQLDLTGTKVICDRGSCGGCTVLMDGKPVYSCMMLALDAQGHRITTVEGLAKGNQLDPVQAAFVEKDALMCGYCTPGFVVSVRALLNRNPNPTLQQVKEACSGNICRCGTYPRIFEAALAAAKKTGQGSGGGVRPPRGRDRASDGRPEEEVG